MSYLNQMRIYFAFKLTKFTRLSSTCLTNCKKLKYLEGPQLAQRKKVTKTFKLKLMIIYPRIAIMNFFRNFKDYIYKDWKLKRKFPLSKIAINGTVNENKIQTHRLKYNLIQAVTIPQLILKNVLPKQKNPFLPEKLKVQKVTQLDTLTESNNLNQSKRKWISFNWKSRLDRKLECTNR